MEPPIELVNQIRVRVLLRLTQISYTTPELADQLALCERIGRLTVLYGYRRFAVLDGLLDAAEQAGNYEPPCPLDFESAYAAIESDLMLRCAR